MVEVVEDSEAVQEEVSAVEVEEVVDFNPKIKIQVL